MQKLKTEGLKSLIENVYPVLGYCNKPVKPRVIHSIVVVDSMFATYEGLRVGQPLTDALNYTKGEPQNENNPSYPFSLVNK